MGGFKKVRDKQEYTYDPVPLDQFDPKSTAEKGQRVRVVKLYGCPPPNTMGHAHIEDLDGKFLGLVACNSLK